MFYICIIKLKNKTYMQNLQCTRFKSVKNTKPEKIENLIDVLHEIATDKYKLQIEEIRKSENPSKSPLKDKLPLFTPTGKFNHRSIAGLEEYNGIICLDIDGVANPIDLKERCKNLHWVYAAFITPSGQGLKVLVKTQATPETYKQQELLVAEAFNEVTGCSRDNHCKDIARIQFVSYDPEIFINEHSVTF
jgi:hypothetical protein